MLLLTFKQQEVALGDGHLLRHDLGHAEVLQLVPLVVVAGLDSVGASAGFSVVDDVSNQIVELGLPDDFR